MKSLPIGRYGICAVHQRLLHHSLPLEYMKLKSEEDSVACSVIDVVSPIHFTVNRVEDKKFVFPEKKRNFYFQDDLVAESNV